MAKNICCGDCERYSPNSNISQNHGICKEYKALVNYSHIICGWYCKRNGGREKTTAKEYIEREEVRDAFYMEFDEDYADDIVDKLPIADVEEVRHAKWELIDECANEGVYCSNCHKKVYRAEYANQKVKSNYCPNCGAKMDKE